MNEGFMTKLEENIEWWRNATKAAAEAKNWSNASECEQYLKGLLWCKRTLKETEKR